MRLLFSRSLEHFLAVYQTGSFRKAASLCNATQPAMTKSVQLLEAAFGLPLFVRGANGTSPTDAAHILQRHAQAIVNSARFAQMEILSLCEGYSGLLRIGCGIVWNATGMPKMLAGLHTKFPKLDISVQADITDRLFPSLFDGHLDVVIARVPSLLPEGFSARTFSDAKMLLFARGAHPLFQKKKRISIAEIPPYDMVGFSFDQAFEEQAEHFFASRNMKRPKMVLKGNSLASLLATVSISDCLVILSEHLVPIAHQYGLMPLLLEEALWKIPSGIFYRTEIENIVPIQYLIEQTALILKEIKTISTQALG